MKNPLFNIIIPTREHASTLAWTIKTCLNQDYGNFRIIVADNISQDNTEEVVSGFKDSRILYVNSGKRLSMSHNWEFSLNFIDEGYAIILGDDDGLVKNALSKVASLIEETNTLAVRTQNTVYHWPDISDKNTNGMLFHIPFSNKHRWINSKQLLSVVSKKLEYLPPYFIDLPTIYHCFVNVEIIKKIKKRDEAFFCSSSPDMYSAVIIAPEIEQYIKFEAPVIVNALSSHSNGLSNNLVQNNKEINKFLSEGIIPFNRELASKDFKGGFLSRPILIADQYLNARIKNKSVPQIDFKNLIMHSIESASNWARLEQYNTVIRETRTLGKLHNLEDFTEELIAASVFQEKKSERQKDYYYNKNEKFLNLDTLPLKAENVFDVSNIIFKIIEDKNIASAITEGKGNIEKIIELLENKNDPFLSPVLSYENIDRYFIRTSILKSINEAKPDFKGVLLDLGCGEMPYRNYLMENSPITKYIGIDIENPVYQKNSKPDLFWDGKKIPLEAASVDTVMATELFEHLPDVQSVLREIIRVLKPGGQLFFTVPFLWPLHDVPYDEYRYTPFSLERYLKNSGFDSIQISPYGGWNASLAQMLGLWLKRSGLNDKDRKTLTDSFFPFYTELLKSDVIPENYNKGPMVPGFSGTAKKALQVIHDEKITHAEDNIKVTEEKLKAIVIVYYFPKLSETFILDQITGLIDQGVDVEIWAQADAKEDITHPAVIRYNLPGRTRYVRFPSGNLNANEWTKQFLSMNKINIGNNDLFHVHFGINFVTFQKLFVEIANTVIVSFHGLDASQYIKQKGESVYNILFERADLITTPSYEMQNVLISIGGKKEKMIIHRYGVNINEFSPSVKNSVNGKIILLTVARLVEKKGIEYSLKAFADLNLSNVIYKIIGEGPLEDDLKQLARCLGVEDRVKFLGPKPKNVIIEEMKNADIYVLTSVTASNNDKEGLPVTLVEAQSIGLPAVSSFHAGIPEIVINNKTGLLSEERDVNSITANLDYLVKNPEIREQFSRESRKRVISEFDIEKLNLALYNTYKKYGKANNLQIKSVSKNENASSMRLPEQFFCPVCKTSSKSFLPYGVNPRPDAMCPVCSSLERHRLLWLFIEKKFDLKNERIRLLHVAPENALRKKFKSTKNIDYISIDLFEKNVTYKMDIQDLKFSSDTFDLIICCHVLEHVYDDILALNECLRVLKPGGTAIIQVPVFQNLNRTIDGRDNPDPEERAKLFGQPDHLRSYGTDFYDRIRLSGFGDIKEFGFKDVSEANDYNRYRLEESEILYICNKTS